MDTAIDRYLAPGAALALALVLAAAAVAKFRTRTETANDFESLGLRRPDILAIIIPYIEVVVAGLLLTQPQWGGIASAALIAGFSTIIVRVLRNPRDFSNASCACFGGSSHQRLSWKALVRNGALFALSVVATLA